ncbi:MAG: AAA family ATPase [Chloroflexota bacterium]
MIMHNPTITRLRAKNYRSLAEVDITLGPLTVLVGPNGAGKSNLVDVLRFGRDALARGLDMALMDRGGMVDIRCRTTSDQAIHLDFHFNSPNWWGQYGFALSSASAAEYRVQWERLTTTELDLAYDEDTQTLETKNDAIIQLPEWMDRSLQKRQLVASDQMLFLSPLSYYLTSTGQRPSFEAVKTFLSNMQFYHIYPDALREPQKPVNPYPLDEQGRNLAAALNHLQQTQNYMALVEALEKVVPEVTGYSVDQVGGYLVTRLHHVSTAAGAPGHTFELAHESDGTLRMLAILAALYQDPPRPLIAIEEPELTIHPGALGVLRDVLLEASRRSQIIITTHSPDLITGFPADVLRVVEKENGMTKVGPVTQSQQEAIAEKLFSPGELMRIEGLRLAPSNSPGA